MADKKESYTKLFNPILEEICKRDFTASELSILFYVIRCTYGWQKKSYTISYGFLVEGTGLSERNVQRTVKNLIDKKVLILYEAQIGRKPQKIGLNKHYSEWLVSVRTTIVKPSHVVSSDRPTNCRQTDTSTIGVQTDQKRNIKKEIIKEEEKKSFTPIFNYTEEELEELRKEGYDV